MCRYTHNPQYLLYYASSELVLLTPGQQNIQVKPDDHSELEPPLPIPNRTVKRLHADDSADTRVKVGNRQAPLKNPLLQQ